MVNNSKKQFNFFVGNRIVSVNSNERNGQIVGNEYLIIPIKNIKNSNKNPEIKLLNNKKKTETSAIGTIFSLFSSNTKEPVNNTVVSVEKTKTNAIAAEKERTNAIAAAEKERTNAIAAEKERTNAIAAEKERTNAIATEKAIKNAANKKARNNVAAAEKARTNAAARLKADVTKKKKYYKDKFNLAKTSANFISLKKELQSNSYKTKGINRAKYNFTNNTGKSLKELSNIIDAKIKNFGTLKF